MYDTKKLHFRVCHLAIEMGSQFLFFFIFIFFLWCFLRMLHLKNFANFVYVLLMYLTLRVFFSELFVFVFRVTIQSNGTIQLEAFIIHVVHNQTFLYVNSNVSHTKLIALNCNMCIMGSCSMAFWSSA